MDFITIFRGTEPEAAIVSAHLEEQGVDATLEGVNVANVAPFLATPAGSGSVEVVVAAADAERATAIIEELQRGREEREEE